jgi:diadenylate cyclase
VRFGDLTAILAKLTWRNVADAIIVGALLYQLIRLIWRRRAGQIVFGLLLLLGASLAAEWLGFSMLRGLLHPLGAYLGFAVFVLFQGEIRRGLALLGGWNPLRGFRGISRPNPYEDVVLAVGRFAKGDKKTGALIVIERQTGLRTHAESGVRLDARLSYDLLLAIFHPESPLHDGAVIVQKDRVAAASCFLPLSVSPDRPRELGSRHRAALGITEETDAVAVVVAEKTGIVSIAAEGAIETGVSEERLRSMLSLLFGKRVVRGIRTRALGTLAATAPVSAPVVDIQSRRKES